MSPRPSEDEGAAAADGVVVAAADGVVVVAAADGVAAVRRVLLAARAAPAAWRVHPPRRTVRGWAERTGRPAAVTWPGRAPAASPVALAAVDPIGPEGSPAWQIVPEAEGIVPGAEGIVPAACLAAAIDPVREAAATVLASLAAAAIDPVREAAALAAATVPASTIGPEGAAVASAQIGPVEVATWPASAAATDRA